MTSSPSPSTSETMLSVASSDQQHLAVHHPHYSQQHQQQYHPQYAHPHPHQQHPYLPPPPQLASVRHSYPPPHQQQPQHRQHQRLPSMPHRVSSSEPLVKSTQPSAAVMQALEIARESEDGASDPTVGKMLDQALETIWDKVKTQPDSYVMSQDEFSLFNYFQHRFIGNSMAVQARRRYWDNTVVN